MPSEFIFLRPWWLLLIPVGLLLTFAVSRKCQDSWQRVCDPSLISELTLISDQVAERFVWLLILVSWSLAVVALAGPAWERKQAVLYHPTDAMVIVFDLSRSMGSVDMAPSRIERARYKALEIVEAHPDKPVGLVVFAGDAFEVVPISDDIGTVTHLLESLQIGMMPVQGSRASAGLARAGRLLEKSDYQSGSVVLLTDGVDEEAYAVVQKLRESGYRLSVIAVGTAAGSPISLDDGNFLKDAADDFIVSPVNYDALAELARSGGGSFSLVSEPFSPSISSAIDFVNDSMRPANSDELRLSWNDLGPWILLALLPLAALMFRRGWIFSLLVLLPGGVQDAYALEWEDLWQRSEQRAAVAVQREEYDDPQLAEHSEWQGVALYRQHKFTEAAAKFGQTNNKIAKFNQGNALAKSGDLLGAITQYESALRMDPEFADAQFNLNLVKQALQQQQTHDQHADAGEISERSSQTTSQSGDQSGDETEQFVPNEERSADEESEREVVALDEERQMALTEANTEEEQQLMEQWLRAIPDDPAGLLRRRFYYEYAEREPVHQPAIAW